MPGKNTIRHFYPNSYYHIYNRGVEKRIIFTDEQDYRMFLYYLFVYLAPKDVVYQRYPDISIRLLNKNLHDEVSLISYCLMPNHFHLLLHQSSKDGASKLVKQLTNAYVRYFNHKHHRVGGLMQGVFKAVQIHDDSSLLQVSRYIHNNPVEAQIVEQARDYMWSSYNHYFSTWSDMVVAKEQLTNKFKSPAGYIKFVENYPEYKLSLKSFNNSFLDNN